jgi:phosphatidylethanolamine/phosphatidyl-N-methylethanolamine N-methyltransferase
MSATSFLRQALRNPRAIASIAPSGPTLGRAMVAALPATVSTVVELGPGTGPVTQALLDHGIPASHIMAVEHNRSLGLALRRKFPSLPVSITDARHLPQVLRDCQWPAQVDAIVSSLPLRALNDETVEQIITNTNKCMRIGGVFIQYSYRTGSPVPDNLCRRLGWKMEALDKVWKNIPPARVYRYTKL